MRPSPRPVSIVLVVGYRQERIRNHFGDGDDWGVTIEYVEQSTQLGTGHAVLHAESAIDDDFLVLNGDRIVNPSLVSRVCDRVRDGVSPTMAVTTVEHPREYGVVTSNGDGRVTHIEEKPEGPVNTNRINAGVYGFSPAIFDAIRETHVTGELALTATLNEIATDRGVTAVPYDGRWLDVSNLWDLLTVNAGLIDENDGSTRGNPPLGDSVSTAADVALAGNIRVGANVTIGGSTAIGSNATIEANAVVENAVIFPDAVIGAGAVVRDAVVAGNAHIGPNATIAGGAAEMVVGDTVHRDIELSGVVVDNTAIGGGATLTEGAVVGDGVQAAAGVVIDSRIAADAVVRRG